MEKWADYLISGIWFTESGSSKFISVVLLHIDKGDTMDRGTKTTKDAVIKLLKAGYSIRTIRWAYSDGKWVKGAKVDYETRRNVEYLRTDPDTTVTDNLDNLIDLGFFNIG